MQKIKYILRIRAHKMSNQRSRPKTNNKNSMMQSSQKIAGVQHAVKELLGWIITVVQHNQMYEIMHLVCAFSFKLKK